MSQACHLLSSKYLHLWLFLSFLLIPVCSCENLYDLFSSFYSCAFVIVNQSHRISREIRKNFVELPDVNWPVFMVDLYVTLGRLASILTYFRVNACGDVKNKTNLTFFFYSALWVAGKEVVTVVLHRPKQTLLVDQVCK